MKTTCSTTWLIALFAFWLALTDHGASAGDKATAKDKIKKLQRERLAAATTARDYFVKQFQAGVMPNGADSVAFSLQLVELNKLVHRARLDLCEKKVERITAIEDSIKVIEPIVVVSLKRFKAGARDAEPCYYLMQAHLLDLKIALEKTNLETGN